jgi:hypothetical protein
MRPDSQTRRGMLRGFLPTAGSRRKSPPSGRICTLRTPGTGP